MHGITSHTVGIVDDNECSSCIHWLRCLLSWHKR